MASLSQMLADQFPPTYADLEPHTWRPIPQKPGFRESLIPLRNDSGGYIQEFMLPMMTCWFGVQDPKDKGDKGQAENEDDGAPKRKNLQLSVTDGNFETWLRNVDKAAIEIILKNCNLVLKRTVSRTSLEEVMYQPLLRLNKKEGFAHNIRLKVSTTGDYPTVVKVNIPGTNQVFMGDASDLTPRCNVIANVQISSFWTSQSSVGISLAAKHLLVFPPQTTNRDPFKMSVVSRPLPSAAGFATGFATGFAASATTATTATTAVASAAAVAALASAAAPPPTRQTGSGDDTEMGMGYEGYPSSYSGY